MRVVVKHKDIFTGKEIVSSVNRDCKIEGYGTSGQNEVVVRLEMNPTKTISVKLTIPEAQKFRAELKACIIEAQNYENTRPGKEEDNVNSDR